MELIIIFLVAAVIFAHDKNTLGQKTTISGEFFELLGGFLKFCLYIIGFIILIVILAIHNAPSTEQQTTPTQHEQVQ
jgi:hypothetical protein